MSKTNWVAFTDVGDASNYVREIYCIVEDIVILCKSILGEIHFGSFCNSFATLFLKNYVKSIHRCKRIGEMGAQQLLLDTHEIKSLFLNLREMGSDETTTTTTTSSSTRRDPYKKRVEEEIKKAESLLKLINYPVDLLASRFPALWPEGTQNDLRAVMSLRGMKANEQNSVLQQASLSDGSISLNNGTAKSISAGSSSSSNPKKKFFSQGFKALERVGSTFKGIGK